MAQSIGVAEGWTVTIMFYIRGTGTVQVWDGCSGKGSLELSALCAISPLESGRDVDQIAKPADLAVGQIFGPEHSGWESYSLETG